MRKVEIEKQAIVKALDQAPNITVAAKDLGASRRTLQARMRDHGLPPGHAGRPRTLLPNQHVAAFRFLKMNGWLALGILGGTAGAIGLLVYLARKKSATVVAGSAVQAVRMTGLDVLGAG